jgi:hypothetical protein
MAIFLHPPKFKDSTYKLEHTTIKTQFPNIIIKEEQIYNKIMHIDLLNKIFNEQHLFSIQNLITCNWTINEYKMNFNGFL